MDEKYKIHHRGDGSIYEGEVNLDNERHGPGKCIDRAGDILQGNWFNGELHGLCKVIKNSGDVYEGEYNHGKQTGIGVMKFVSSG